MCGIFGYVGGKQVVNNLLEGLKRLEYRGYDSAGVAVLEAARKLEVVRSAGQVENLSTHLAERGVIASRGGLGLAHTRWATHGAGEVKNAHPHVDCIHEMAVVHNGIIKNHGELRRALQQAGHTFSSDTDSEVLPHLIESVYRGELIDAVKQVLPMLKGSYAFGVIHNGVEREHIVAARNGSPLVVGLGEGEAFLASDTSALLGKAREYLLLEDGDVADVMRGVVRVFDASGAEVQRVVRPLRGDASTIDLRGHQHYMAKEIAEQPEALAACLRGRLTPDAEQPVALPELAAIADALTSCARVVIGACGTSRHAALLGKAAIERFAHCPVEVEIASEFPLREGLVDRDTVFIAVSQSGETADTMTALRKAAKEGATTLGICNVETSTLAREAKAVLLTRAGPEIGVASTKAYVTQVAAFETLALFMAALRRGVEPSLREAARELQRLPLELERAMPRFDAIEAIARHYLDARCFLYLGRGAGASVALEGALKLEELSYVPAIGLPAGEMKHGPIALVDASVPSVFIAPGGAAHDKLMSNMQEIRARRGPIVALATDGDHEVAELASHVIWLPRVPPSLHPYLCAVALQRFAYHLTCLKGLPVDKPRNLAKSVTVE